MPEQKRPITQLWNFSPTVAKDPLPNASSPSSDTQIPKNTTSVNESEPSESASFLKNDISTSQFESNSSHTENALPRSYNEFMTLDQAGLVTIGSENNEESSLVAIKKIKKVDKNPVHRIKPFTSDHLVQIREIFEDGDDVVIIYETMDVTLRQLTGILQGPLKPFQIAAICKELLEGLTYLHKKLAYCHGALSCDTILLNLDGRVKIGNIAESFINNRRLDPESERNDIRSIGSIMMELMEPETFILEPQCTLLRNPEVWKDSFGIKDFLAATQSSTLDTLQNHDFLPKKPIRKCLRPHVFCAVRAANLGCDIISLS